MWKKLVLSLVLLFLFCSSGFCVVVLSDEEAQELMQNIENAENEVIQLKENSKKQQEDFQMRELTIQKQLEEVQKVHEKALQQQKEFYKKQLKEARKGKISTFFTGTLTGAILTMGAFILLL